MAGLQTDKDAIVASAEAQRNEAQREKEGLGTVASLTGSSQELDDVHEGLEFPTLEERKTLRRVSDRLPMGAYRES